jgi:hypothetical protein
MGARAFTPLLALLLILCGIARAAPATQAPSPPDIGAVRAALVGTWQSLDDTRFSREFDADGRSADRYEGDADDSITGTWAVFLGKAPPPDVTGRKFEPNAVYLRLRQNGDELFFGLMGLSRSDLKMVFLERGNLLTFTRLK